MANSDRSYVTQIDQATVAEVMLRHLASDKVDTVFGIPGGGLMQIPEVLKDQRDAFRYVICRHETGAGYMADGYYRATGKLGVVVVTSGPGATNTLDRRGERRQWRVADAGH